MTGADATPPAGSPGRARLRLALLLAVLLASAVALIVRLNADDAAAADASAGEWTALPGNGFPRQEVAFTEAAGRLYLFGGTNDERQQVFDPAGGTWADTTDLGDPAGKLDHIQAVTLGTRIFYVGGLITWPAASPNTPTGAADWATADVATVHVFDTVTQTWSTAAPMPNGRERGGGGVAVYNGDLYYVGGIHDGQAVGWMDRYDPDTNTWTSLPANMPTARDHFHALVIDGKLWAIGGRNGPTAIQAPMKVNEAYNFSTGTWSSYAPIPTQRAGYGAAILGCEIVVIGGEGQAKSVNPKGVFTAVEAYNVATNTWRTLTPLPDARARHGIQAVSSNGSVYIAAGGLNEGGGGATDMVDRLTFTPQSCAVPGGGGGPTTTTPTTTPPKPPATTTPQPPAATTPVPAVTATTAAPETSCCASTAGEPPATTPPVGDGQGQGGTVGGSGAPDGPAADTTRPVLARVTLSRTRFTLGGPVAKRGIVLSYRLSEPATMRLTVSRRSGKKRRAVKGAVTWTAKAGAGSKRFTGRIGGRPLQQGQYVLTLTAIDASSNRSSAVRRSFTVLRRTTQ